MKLLAVILIINAVLIIILGIAVFLGKNDTFNDITNGKTESSKYLAVIFIATGVFVLFLSTLGILFENKSLLLLAAGGMLLSIVTCIMRGYNIE